jgi:hypothetical protein
MQRDYMPRMVSEQKLFVVLKGCRAADILRVGKCQKATADQTFGVGSMAGGADLGV